VGNADRTTEAGGGAAGDAQEMTIKRVKIQKMFFSRIGLLCLKFINSIVPKAKGSKWRGNKTDTIVIFHVDISLLFALICNRSGIDGAACDPTKCALCVDGCGGRRHTGFGQCFYMAGANAVRFCLACMGAAHIICESDFIPCRRAFVAFRG